MGEYMENLISDQIDGGLELKKQQEENTMRENKKERLKTHYAPSGEWGNPKTYCGRYWTTDIKHRALIDEVTCKDCLKLL